MATLSVKNLSDDLHARLRAQARRHHRSIAQEVRYLLEGALGAQEPLSLLDLRGLGKEAWRAVEAAEHVGAERRSWD